MKTLNEIATGERAIISKIKGRSSFRRRLTEMGFIKGKEVFVVKNAPLRDPIEYRIMDYSISLRRSEAMLIVVTDFDENAEFLPYSGVLTNGEQKISKQKSKSKSKTKIEIAFVGNPNSGKTSLFNSLTGSYEHVGNYSGVTVDAKKSSRIYNGYQLEITDLPGTYSLSPNSPDEIFVRNHLLKDHPDVVVNVVDASNLERNLYLTCQLIDMDIKVILALNMYDEFIEKRDVFDHRFWGKMIGIPVIPTVGSKKEGINELLEKIVDVYEDKDHDVRHIHINYGEEIEASINRIQRYFWKNESFTGEYSSRYFSIRLLEKDSYTPNNIQVYPNHEEIKKKANEEIQRLENIFKDDTQTLIANARYGFISGALRETYTKSAPTKTLTNTEKIDKILTGKYSGIPIFLLILWFIFQSTFIVGQYPADWISLGIEWLGQFISTFMNIGPLRDLLVNGILGGLGGVLVFLPNIMILFFFISLMEDTGYMARVSFIMDKLMHLLGLHGKSFIPLIMGFGCNVPAIMATRTLENRNDRLITMLIIPFMSCSARLPIYILIAGTFFPNNAGTVIFSIYILGIIVSILTAILLRKTAIKAVDAPFVMELPPYRIPTAQSSVRHMWFKAKQYLKKMSGVILWASIIIWFLSYYPRTNSTIENLKLQKVEVENRLQASNQLVQTDSMRMITENYNATIASLQAKIITEQQGNSFLGKIGKVIEPVIRPLGYDWRIGVALLSGISAKEVLVSTLGVLYAGDPSNDEHSKGLRYALANQVHDSGKLTNTKVFTLPVALGFMVFVLLYVPCIAVIATIKKESGKLRWTIWSIVYSTTLAWTMAFLTFKIAGMFL